MTVPTLLFRVGTGVYGCDITQAREIIPQRPLTRLPGAPPFVRGLLNVRGLIVTVLDLGMRLDPSAAPTRDGSILLVQHQERLVGLIVAEVHDVRSLEIDGAEGTQSGPPTAGGGIVHGVATADEQAVVVLDLAALIRQVLLT